MPGLIALVGGDEFNPGNEEHDRILIAGRSQGPAYVIPTAASRGKPQENVAHATRWFAGLGLEVIELPVLKRRDALSGDLAARALGGGFFYLVGGDPGIVPAVLQGSPVWGAVIDAWQRGASLAGSSAGAMALCSQTLVRATWPGRVNRRPVPGLGVIPNTAVLPHYDTFGQRWIESAQAAAPGLTLVGVDERSAVIWASGEWRACGPGRITVIHRGRRRTFDSGEPVTGIRQPVRMVVG